MVKVSQVNSTHCKNGHVL